MRPATWSLLLLLGGCSRVAAQDGACDVLEGLHFASVAEYECGLGPNGIVLCHWDLRFSARDDDSSSFVWDYSDVQESGACECDGAEITTLPDFGEPLFTGHYDPDTGLLSWEDRDYAEAP